MKAYGGVGVQSHIIFTLTLAGGAWSTSRSGRFTPPPGTYRIGGWVNHRAGLDNVEKRKFLTPPGLELRRLGRPARSQSLYRLHSILGGGNSDREQVAKIKYGVPVFWRRRTLIFSDVPGSFIQKKVVNATFLDIDTVLSFIPERVFSPAVIIFCLKVRQLFRIIFILTKKDSKDLFTCLNYEGWLK
jgi:hypothetical protein